MNISVGNLGSLLPTKKALDKSMRDLPTEIRYYQWLFFGVFYGFCPSLSSIFFVVKDVQGGWLAWWVASGWRGRMMNGWRLPAGDGAFTTETRHGGRGGGDGDL